MEAKQQFVNTDTIICGDYIDGLAYYQFCYEDDFIAHQDEIQYRPQRTEIIGFRRHVLNN